ncbi:uncharacterized protein FA14DRAFT_174483 [Meira miltonrushii]|uniref:Uncharacterized protein n=1 Tax=Meira miltonrushii TaxID=1280837 RepID=A0A316V5L0_9BASI|nr:uncharacterized protein FA14DRAFT_174483 [Meira miltonrushii]PWN32806.1 hypothetical protein FA14DRAFT_174483 [Meira miltonrushii]
MARPARKGGEAGRDGRMAQQDAPPEKISRYARVTRLATDQSVDQEATNSKLEQVDSGLLERIRKMLKLAQHPNTTEAEAKQALRASARMLSAANLTEAEVMSKETAEEQAQRAGHSIVTIRHRDGKHVSLEQWSITLGHTINKAFNVKYFHTTWSSHDRIEFTFYGLRHNTVAAVISFEAVFNLALTWAADRTDVKGRTGKNSYLLGLSSSLYQMAKKEKKAEEEQAVEAEKHSLLKSEIEAVKLEERQQSRLDGNVTKSGTVADEDDEDDIVFVSIKHGPKREYDEIKVKNEGSSSENDLGDIAPGAITDGDESDDEFVDARADDDEEGEEELGDIKAEQERFDAAFDRRAEPSNNGTAVKQEDIVKSEPHDGVPPAVKEETEGVKVKFEDEAAVPAWQSHAQLTIFKETAARIADDYLKEMNTKIRNRKAKRNTAMHDSSAYKKGQEDARKVDLKRRRLEAD